MASQPRLVIGSDDAGFPDEEALTSDLQVDLPVTSVVDIGVDRALVLRGTDLELAHRLGHEWLTHRSDTTSAAADEVAEITSYESRGVGVTSASSARVADGPRDHPGLHTGKVEVFVVPTHLQVPAALDAFAGTGVHVGAQDLATKAAEHVREVAHLLAADLRGLPGRTGATIIYESSAGPGLLTALDVVAEAASLAGRAAA